MTENEAARINQLEQALAHQEALVSDLSDELAKQWLTIERMNRRLQEMEGKVDSLRPAADTPEGGEPPPPHY